LIFEGNTRFQIGRRLQCADSTVRVYIDRVFAKLNVVDRLGMALRILRVHLALQRKRPADHVGV
jgi:DNA-binding NarL/FixJ family response regulator